MDFLRTTEAPGADVPSERSDEDLLRSRTLERIAHLVLAATAWIVLGVAWTLEPSPEGLGTHEQLGMAPCGFHQMLGIPCPTCGMTTAFACLAHGDVAGALVSQPFALVLFALTAAAAVALMWSFVRGRSLLPKLYSPKAPWVIQGFLLLWMASWAFKIAYGQITGGYGL
jgi:hypothetical protein